MELEFAYDVVCPYAYVASTRVEALAAEAGVRLRWTPVLLGGIYKHIGAPQYPAMGPAKARHNALDMTRQAERAQVPLTLPAAHPRRTVDAMRLLVGAPAERVPALTHALFRAYWVEGRDVADKGVLTEIATACEVDPAVMASPEARQQLFDNTASVAGRGAFGVPTFFVGDQLVWGADRMHLVGDALGLARPPEPTGDGGRTVTLFHDFASPFSYLASTQIRRVAAQCGATIEYVPILLGALFKNIGTANVPLLTLSPAKQRWVQQDLLRWARWWGVDLRWPSTFPLRTVAPLRVAIAEPAATDAMYRAAWAEDRDIGDPRVLAEVLDDAGFDATALLARTQDPTVKAQLFANTQRAQEAGVFGVPSFQVDGKLWWGQDRLDMVAAALVP